MNRKTLLALRDPHGVRPLVLGKAPWGYAFASEPPALLLMGAEYVRDVRPGEVVWVEEGRLQSLQALPPEPAPCAFEWIYFARPDSVLDGTEAYEARVRMGMELFREAPAEADLVVPVPDSGIGAAVGYAKASGLPLEFGLYKNPYAGRTFIQPTQELRDLKTRLKLSPTGAVKGKRVVLVDDSIVRGTTSRRIVRMLKEAGATRVHFRVSSPHPLPLLLRHRHRGPQGAHRCGEERGGDPSLHRGGLFGLPLGGGGQAGHRAARLPRLLQRALPGGGARGGEKLALELL